MCNVAGCTFCCLISGFGALFMFLLGITIKSNYQFVGEWYHPHEGQGSPTSEQIATASANCFAVGGIYIGFTVMAIACIWWHGRRSHAHSA